MMRRSLLAACAVVALYAGSAGAADLPLKRVTLSTSGLAQFEHQGSVTGNQSVELPVRLDQVDDVLKSLVVLDDGGSFGGVSLPGRKPVEQIFKDLPFKQRDLNSFDQLLTALQGAEVRIATAGGTIAGRLVNVAIEETIVTGDRTVRRHRVTVMGRDGVRTAVMEDLKNLQFTAPEVQAQLDRALAAIHDHRVQDMRTVTLDLRGEGARAVNVSYVTAAPLWKSAYRLVLPEAAGGKAYLQGWAILENTTGQDWKDVAVTLLSGSPVTYKQSLYESYYLDRPFLPLRVMDRLMPRTDTGSVPVVATALQVQPPDVPGAVPPMRREKRADYGAADGAMAKMNMAVAAAPAMDMAESVAVEGYGGAAPMPTQMAAAPMTAMAEQAAAQMVFTFPQSVTVPAGNSMMLPMISRDIPADQLWLYQPDTNPRHPLSAVSLQNDSETGLPPGILTLFERGKAGLRYTGDAELALLPKGEKRYITFALDPATTIDRTVSADRQYGAFTAAGGVVRQKVISAETTTYTIKAPADADRTLVIEQPRRGDWEIKPPEGLVGEVEKTESHYRLKIALKAGETKELKVVLEHPEFEALSLGDMSPEDLTARIAALGPSLDPQIRKVLDQAVALQNDVYAVTMQIQPLEEERQTIFNDQQRVRENMQSIPENSDIAKRYLAQMNAQEDRIQAIDAQIKALRQKQAEARRKLQDYIRGMTL